MKQFFRIFPDVHVHNDPYPIQFGSGNWITVITRVTGTVTGEMTLPDDTVIPSTGKSFDVEFAQTVKWDGDRVIEIAAFWTPPCRHGKSASHNPAPCPPARIHDRHRRHPQLTSEG